MPDGGEEIARRAKCHRHQERVRRIAERFRHHRRDRPQYQHRGHVVQERRHQHRDHQHQPHRQHPRQPARGQTEPVRQHRRRPGAAQALTDRDQAAEHHQDRPVDRGIRLARRDRPRSMVATAAMKNAASTGSTPLTVSHHRRRQDEQRQQPEAPPADREIALGERQAAELAQRVRKLLAAALQHDHVAEAEPAAANPPGNRPPAAADRQHIHLVALSQPQPLRAVVDQRAVRRDDCFHRPQLVVAIARAGGGDSAAPSSSSRA